MTLYDFSIFKEMLKVDHHMLTKKDEDNLIVLCGKEGKGKSRLGLWAIDHWFDICKIEKTEENFKNAMGVTATQWSNIMKRIGKNRLHGSINDFDEAGDVLSGKHSSGKVVRSIEDAYKVIRGLNLESVITSPDLFILSPYIRNWRVKVVWFVSERGICHIYYGKTLKKLISHNENKEYKDMFVVPSDISFVIPLYDGAFLKPYLEMKHKKMYDVLDNLNSVVVEDEKKRKAKA